MKWGQCLALFMLLAVQAYSAGQMVNLLEPAVGPSGPSFDISYLNRRSVRFSFRPSLWKMFDRDLSTFPKRTRRVVYVPFTDDNFRPTKYRITMAAHVPKKDYPSKWTVNFFDSGGSSVIGSGKRKDFKNGVHEGDLSNYKTGDPFHGMYFKFSSKATIAEIEMLGNRKALNALWPHGKYPCSQRLTMIDAPRGRSIKGFKGFLGGIPVKQTPRIRSVFDARAGWRREGRDHGVNDQKGGRYGGQFIVGAVLPKRPLVHEVVVFAYESRSTNTVHMVEKLWLQGSNCDTEFGKNGCNEVGQSGWVTLGGRILRGNPRVQSFQYHFRFAFEKPVQYKAYRLRHFPCNKKNCNAQRTEVDGIYFLGCEA